MTSWPESLFSLGIYEGVDFEVGDDRGMGYEVVVGEILSLKMQVYGLFEIGYQFIERNSLSYNRKVDAFGDIKPFAFVDMYLNDLFHGLFIAFARAKVK